MLICTWPLFGRRYYIFEGTKAKEMVLIIGHYKLVDQLMIRKTLVFVSFEEYFAKVIITYF
jgi:hypothetical protein